MINLKKPLAYLLFQHYRHNIELLRQYCNIMCGYDVYQTTLYHYLFDDNSGIALPPDGKIYVF